MKNMKLLGGDKIYKIFHDIHSNQYLLQYVVEVPISKDYIDSLDKFKGNYIINGLKNNINALFSDLVQVSITKFYDVISNYRPDELIQEIAKNSSKLFDDEGENFINIQTAEEASYNVDPVETIINEVISEKEIEELFLEEQEDDFKNLNTIDARYKMIEDFNK
jgi:hypothetical protein